MQHESPPRECLRSIHPQVVSATHRSDPFSSLPNNVVQDIGTLMMVDHMKRNFGVTPDDVRCFQGPSKGGARYEAKPASALVNRSKAMCVLVAHRPNSSFACIWSAFRALERFFAPYVDDPGWNHPPDTIVRLSYLFFRRVAARETGGGVCGPHLDFPELTTYRLPCIDSPELHYNQANERQL